MFILIWLKERFILLHVRIIIFKMINFDIIDYLYIFKISHILMIL